MAGEEKLTAQPTGEGTSTSKESLPTPSWERTATLPTKGKSKQAHYEEVEFQLSEDISSYEEEEYSEDERSESGKPHHRTRIVKKPSTKPPKITFKPAFVRILAWPNKHQKGTFVGGSDEEVEDESDVEYLSADWRGEMKQGSSAAGAPSAEPLVHHHTESRENGKVQKPGVNGDVEPDDFPGLGLADEINAEAEAAAIALEENRLTDEAIEKLVASHILPHDGHYLDREISDRSLSYSDAETPPRSDRPFTEYFDDEKCVCRWYNKAFKRPSTDEEKALHEKNAKALEIAIKRHPYWEGGFIRFSSRLAEVVEKYDETDEWSHDFELEGLDDVSTVMTQGVLSDEGGFRDMTYEEFDKLEYVECLHGNVEVGLLEENIPGNPDIDGDSYYKGQMVRARNLTKSEKKTKANSHEHECECRVCKRQAFFRVWLQQKLKKIRAQEWLKAQKRQTTSGSRFLSLAPLSRVESDESDMFNVEGRLKKASTKVKYSKGSMDRDDWPEDNESWGSAQQWADWDDEKEWKKWQGIGKEECTPEKKPRRKVPVVQVKEGEKEPPENLQLVKRAYYRSHGFNI